MNEQEAALALEKAVKNLNAAHHKKAASHNDAKAASHEKMAEAHKAHAAHNEAMEGEEGSNKVHHKASKAFHKAKAAHHERINKAHVSMAEHHRKMAEAYTADSAEKIYKILGETPPEVEKTEVEKATGAPMSEPTNTQTTPKAAAAAAPAPTPAASPAVAAPASSSMSSDISKVLDESVNKQLTKAINDGLERVLNSPEFTKAIEERLAGKMLERLGSAPAPTEVKTFAVPRPGESIAKRTDGAYSVDTSGVDPEFAHLAAVEDRA